MNDIFLNVLLFVVAPIIIAKYFITISLSKFYIGYIIFGSVIRNWDKKNDPL